MEYRAIKEFCNVSSSKRIFAEQYVDEGIPFYRQKEIIEKGLHQTIEDPIYITEETYNNIKAKFGAPQNGDLLITAVGVTLGIPYVVDDEVFYFKDGNLIWLSRFDNSVNSKYVYYWLSTSFGHDSIYMRAIGSAQPAITIDIVKKYKLFLPNRQTQDKIVDIMSGYDLAIENNNKRIKILEQMAENLYKEWFVRFRFPGHEDVEFENGIPKGWEVKRLNEVLSLLDSQRKPLSSMERDGMAQNYPYYGAAGQLGYVEDYIFDGTYLLLGEDGSVITEEGYPYLQYVWGKFWVNNHAHIIEKNGKFSVEFLYCLFKKMNIQAIVTGVAQPKISQGRLLSRKVIIPDDNTLLRFDELIQPIFLQIKKLTESNQNLIKQRDLLLPRLMSGKLQVK